MHTRSYATLTLARSARIADVLHIADPVQSARCTVCHAPFQSIATNDALRKVLDPAAGVSCETCHGAAQNWLLSHTRSDFTHQDRVNAGMRDLKNLYVRANTCVACHQNVDADILQAGHPELIFELDGQAVAQPKHWRESTNWSGPQAWFVGQAVALREMSWQVNREEAPSQAELEREQGLLWLVENVGWNSNVPQLMAAPSLEFKPDKSYQQNVQSWADQMAASATYYPSPPDPTSYSLGLLAATAGDFRNAKVSRTLKSRRAERLVLGLDRLVAGLKDDAHAKRLDAPLNKLFKDAQSLPDFDPKIFANDLDEFQKILSANP